MDETIDDGSNLSIAVKRRIDETCDRFEAALQAGEAASLAEYLAAAVEPERGALFRELTSVEVEYRIRRHEQPTIDEYRLRFPEYADSIQAAWFPGQDAKIKLPDVPGYEILAKLPAGGMAVVYKARHVKLQHIVAIKMPLAGACASAEERQQFLHEARAMARLQHPNIVRIHDIGEHNGVPYFSMEYLEGGNLAERLKAAPPSDKVAAEVVKLLARTVHYAHQRGIIHRDLKPANILLTADRIPKIADFGLAKVLSEYSGATRTGTIKGTASYMAPEQAIGDTKAIAEPVDIYALGAILYELLTGRPPFRERTVIETLQKVIEGSPIEPHKINPRVDRGPDAICMKCLAKAKSERYATASELADDLDRFLNGDRPSAQKGAATVWIDAVVRESPYTEIMRLWSGIWMWLACNAFVIAILQGLLLWYAVDDFLPYILLWVFKVVGDVAAAWLLRIRNGPPPLPVERQLMLIWAFFWVSHILMTWFYMRTGASAAAFMPIIDVELAVVLGSMAAILGGSFYIAAALCIVKAILEAYWPGAGCLFAATVVCPYFFVLGWRHRRADVES